MVLLLLTGILIPLSACAVFRERKPFPPSVPDLQACFTREVLVSASPQERDSCVSLLEHYLSEREGDPSSDRAALQLSRFYMERGDFAAAYNLMLPFSERYPRSREKNLARLYLAICLYYLDDAKGSLDVLHRLVEEPDADSLYVEAGRYIAENYLKLGQLLSALAWYEKCDAMPLTLEARHALRERVLSVVWQHGDRETFARAETLFPVGFFHEAVRLGSVAAVLRSGDVRSAEHGLRELALRHRDDLFTPFIQALSERTGREILPEVGTVGCLLPLSGRHGRFGKGILDALVLGAGAFRDGEGETAIRLLVRDTAGDPDTALRHLRELAENPEVMGVVGPLLLHVSRACAEEAERLGLPMISLTQGEDLALQGAFVFQNGLTIRQQVENLVEYAMEDLGITLFAVLYPADEFGAVARDLYREKVLAMGGEVVSEVSYKKEETDFQEEIRALLGEKYWREMKRREEEQRKRDAFRRSSLSRFGHPHLDPSHPLEEDEEEEPLVTPFQALFVPDPYRKASLIAPYLAFYDLNDVVLLGNSTWNSVHLVREAGEYVRGAVFVDGFFAESEMPHVRWFVHDFEQAFGRNPRTLEAQGYDSLLILEEAFREAYPRTRARVREVLARTTHYPGVSGSTSFDEHGRAVKRLYLLTVYRNRILEIQGQ